MKKNKFLKSIIEERKKRTLNKNINNIQLSKFWDKLKKDKNKISLRTKIAFEIAKNLNYNHGNLLNNNYFFHPLRIATMSYKLKVKDKDDLLILALLHNCLETTNISIDLIQNLFGNKILQEIKVLTVERKRQWNKEYKNIYYKKINNFSLNTKIIKILDKLDNLFVLNNNPNLNIKKKYLKEIETHVLPMVQKNTPFLNNYFNNLIKNTYLLMNKI